MQWGRHFKMPIHPSRNKFRRFQSWLPLHLSIRTTNTMAAGPETYKILYRSLHPHCLAILIQHSVLPSCFMAGSVDYRVLLILAKLANCIRSKNLERYFEARNAPIGSKNMLISSIVPVNLKDRDAFHLSIEEYLQALISLIDELVSLSPL